MTEYTIVSVFSITVVAFLIGEVLKIKKLNVDKDFIPPICGLIGGILGVSGFYLIDEFPSANVLDSLATGILSGWAATGANEAIRRLIGKIGGKSEDK